MAFRRHALFLAVHTFSSGPAALPARSSSTWRLRGWLVGVVAVAAVEWIALRRADAVASATEVRLGQLRIEGAALAHARSEASSALERTRGEVTKAAAIAKSDAELDAEVDAWLDRERRLREAYAAHAEQAIPEVGLLTDDDWFELGRDAEFGNEEKTREALAAVRTAARQRVGRDIRAALVRFADEHGGALPADLRQLAPYMQPAVPVELFDRYSLLQHGSLADLPMNEWLIAERTAPDEETDSRLVVQRGGVTTPGFGELSASEMRQALRAFQSSRGRLPASSAELLPYFSPAPRPVAVKALLAKPPSDFAAEAKRIADQP